MAESSSTRQGLGLAVSSFLSLVYSLVIRDLRTSQRGAAFGVLVGVAQPLILGLIFYVMIELFGRRNSMVRGDDLTFVMTGFILFFFHIRTANDVAGAIKKNMMNHARTTPFLFAIVKSVSAGYSNLLAAIILFLMNYLLRGVAEMQDLLRFAIVLFWAWLGGLAVGMIFMALKEYFSWGNTVQTVYTRVMFFTSGKFFVANLLGPGLRPLFDWNPLFHLVDQMRDAVFVNYSAKFTSMAYPATLVIICLAVGFLAEHYLRRNYNISRFPK